MTQQIYTTPTPFSGTNISIPNSGKGYTSNMVIKGQAYQNLLNRIEAGGNCTINDTTININCTDGTWSLCNIYLNPVLVNSKTYTVILNCISLNTPNGNVEISGFDIKGNWKVGTNIKQGLNKFIIKNLDISLIKLQTSTRGNSTTVDKNIIILEGDWTNKEVPTEITGIESVGEKEDNKISILSHNKNLLNPSLCEGGNVSEIGGYVLTDPKGYYRTYLINVKQNTDYYVNNVIKDDYTFEKAVLYQNGIFKTAVKSTIFNTNNANQIRIVFQKTHDTNVATPINIFEKSKPFIVQSSSSQVSYEPYKEDKKEILLPIEGGLKSLPDGTCDTIEQREDGVYLVQKVGKIVLNGSENWLWFKTEPSGLGSCQLPITNIATLKPMTTTRLKRIYWTNSPWNSKDECISIGAEDNKDLKDFNFVVYLNANTLNDFKANLQANPVTVYYELATAIETKLDIDNINLQTFKDLTYVTSDNSIEPVLEFKAPILGYKTINPIQLKTTQDGTEVNVYPYSTPELITFGDNETLADKMNNIENTHTHNNATVTTDGFMSKESYSKLESLTNYTHPSTHAATMITEDSTHRFITDTERNN